MRHRLRTAVLAAAALTLCGATTAQAGPPAAASYRTVQQAATADTLAYTWIGQATEYYCGPAATAMAISTHQTPPDQSTLAGELHTTTDGTPDISDVTAVLNSSYGNGWYESKYVDITPTAAQQALLKSDVLLDIDHGMPIVADVWSGWRPPGYPSGEILHYVTIVGYQDSGDSVVVADPAGAGAGGPSWQDVPEQYVVSVADMATWIGGKGYSA